MPPLNKLNEDSELSFSGYWHYNHGIADHSNSFSSLPSTEDAYPPEFALKRRRSTQIRFSTTVEYHEVLHRSEYTRKEMQDCWYTASDYSFFKADISATVCLWMTNPSAMDGVDFTSRGVECRVPATVTKRHQLKAKAKRAVFDEQDFQRAMGERDVDRIAELYSDIVAPSVQESLELACADDVPCDPASHLCCTTMKKAYGDEFTDDWITSLSSEPSPIGIQTFEDLLYTTTDDSSGFDDSWLRDIYVRA